MAFCNGYIRNAALSMCVLIVSLYFHETINFDGAFAKILLLLPDKGAPPPDIIPDVVLLPFLPNNTSAWVENPGRQNESTCRSSLLHGRSINVIVHIPRVTPGYLPSYGNAITNIRGLRLHAFMGVNSSSFPWFNTHRIVSLTRDVDHVLNTFPDWDQESPFLLSSVSHAAGIVKLADCPVSPVPSLVFFDIDNSGDALIHWLMESAVFLEYWHDLFLMYPTVKLILRTRKSFKVAVATVFFGIPESSIVYAAEGAAAMDQGLPSSLTFFPPLISLHENVSPDLPFMEALWKKFIATLRAVAGVETPGPWIPSEALVLARGTKENFAFNDRREELLDRIAGRDAEHLQLAIGESLQVVSYDTFLDMRDQVELQSRAKVCIVAYGSAHLLNGALSRNATIFVSNAKHYNHHADYPYLRVAQSFIEDFNRVVWLSGDEDAESVIAAMNAWMSSQK